jgi:hypothetical protein
MKVERNLFALECPVCPGLLKMKKGGLLVRLHLLNVGIALAGKI